MDIYTYIRNYDFNYLLSYEGITMVYTLLNYKYDKPAYNITLFAGLKNIPPQFESKYDLYLYLLLEEQDPKRIKDELQLEHEHICSSPEIYIPYFYNTNIIYMDVYGISTNYRFDSILDNDIPYTSGFYDYYSRLLDTITKLNLTGDNNIKLLQYYSYLVDKYGFNTKIIRNIPTESLSSIYETLSFKITEFRSMDDIYIFLDKHSEWVYEQIEQTLPFSNSIDKYVNHSYTGINTSCRVGGRYPDELTYSLIRVFNFLSPLPEGIFVHRYVLERGSYKLNMNEIYKENGFMSVSLLSRLESYKTKQHRKNNNVYMSLYVPKGVICLNVLPYNIYETEFILPPGTQYILLDKNSDDDIKHYYGLII